jgi:hypothetical protein
VFCTTSVIELDNYVKKFGIEAALESIERANNKWAAKPLYKTGFNTYARSSYVECGVTPLGC